MNPRVAAWTRPRPDLEAVYDDVDRCRALSPEQAVAEAAALSRCALSFLARFSPEERRRLLFEQEAMDPRWDAAWRELVRRGRAG